LDVDVTVNNNTYNERSIGRAENDDQTTSGHLSSDSPNSLRTVYFLEAWIAQKGGIPRLTHQQAYGCLPEALQLLGIARQEQQKKDDRITKLEQDLKDLHALHNEVKKKHQNTIDALNRDLDAESAYGERYNESTASSAEYYKEVAAKIKDYESKNDQLKFQILDLKYQLLEYEREKGGPPLVEEEDDPKRQRLLEIDGRLGSLEEEAAGTDQRLTDLSEKWKDISEQIEDARSKVNDLEHKSNKSPSDKDLKSQLESATKEVERLTTERETVEKDKSRARWELNDTKEEVVKLRVDKEKIELDLGREISATSVPSLENCSSADSISIAESWRAVAATPFPLGPPDKKAARIPSLGHGLSTLVEEPNG
jgi:chromosome segregation ATPase